MLTVESRDIAITIVKSFRQHTSDKRSTVKQCIALQNGHANSNAHSSHKNDKATH